MGKLVQSPRIDPRFACFKLAIKPSKIHRFGVYAAEPIPANRKVIEYTGQRISNREANKRDWGKYTYLFELDRYWTLDGSIGGSGAEIINHSCSPNIITRVMKGHIIYMSLRPIKRGEELTVHYNFAKDADDPSPCCCGAKNCRGTMTRED
jgi:SET domain-containing protein